ncbi:MAG: fibronectin type III domain-containing protein [Eubacterium sp.]|nr:fibronectin type III domain-containing protein [Eubacterium sp.]
MKKSLSIILSFVMLFCSVSFTGNAFAYTKKEAPAVSLGENFKVKQKAISVKQLEKINADDLSKTDFYCAKFTPDKTGYYEFVFDTDFIDKSDEATLIAFIFNKNEEAKATVMCFAYDESYAKEYKKLSLTSNPSMSTKLVKNKSYYLAVINVGKKAYKSNVVVNRHTHEYYESKMRSYVDKKDLKKCYDGKYYNACSKNGCDYVKTNKTIPSIKKISLSHNFYTYNSRQKRPIVTVKNRRGEKISKKNYKVKYSKNTSIGTGTVKITFKNEYEGSFTKTFRINPRGTEIKSLTPLRRGFDIKYKKRSKRITGYQVQYATDKNFTKNKKTATVKGTKNTSQRIKQLNRKQKYFIRVRTYKVVKNKKYYSAWSKIKTVKTR